MWAYLAVFLTGLAVDAIPVFAPPAWTIILPIAMKFKLNIWATAGVGAVGSTIGRYALSRYMPALAGRVFNRRVNENVVYLGKKLSGHRWTSFLFVLGYCLTPLSTTALFTAAGAAHTDPLPLLPAFLIGKFASDAFMIFNGKRAALGFRQILAGEKSAKSLVAAAFALLMILTFLFIDWHQLLERGRLRMNFDVWRRKGRR
jgi:hypothetical protein